MRDLLRKRSLREKARSLSFGSLVTIFDIPYMKTSLSKPKLELPAEDLELTIKTHATNPTTKATNLMNKMQTKTKTEAAQLGQERQEVME